MITQLSIEGLKQVIDIIDVIGGYIELKRVGSNFSACCPFHDEKTPSFIVNRTKGLYHCYGCGVGGDAIKFVMEYEKISFAEAVEKIAEICNYPLEYEKSTILRKDDSKLLEAMARFYHKRLLELAPYREYLLQRGVSEASIEKFTLGFCGASFESVRFVQDNGLSKDELVALGVLGEDQARVYARFAERIMFPIHSPNGKVVGFGGRTLKEGLAKYINSPQSKQFNKSKLLYGYHIAKEHIYKYNQIIITEGYLDVILLHQAGFNTAVATLGTALTSEHLPLLAKGSPKIILSYDGDKAGINAALRASEMLAKESKTGGVVIFEGGLDPADMVVQKKTDVLQALFSKPMPFIEFVLTQLGQRYDLNDPLQKQNALQEALKFLHTLTPLLQEEYKGFIAQILKVPPHLITTHYKGNAKSLAYRKPSIKPSSKPLSPLSSYPLRQDDSRLESLVIKYILEDRMLLDRAIEYVDVRAFVHKGKEFDALCRGDFEYEGLIGIALDEGLLLREDGFEQELLLLLLAYQQRKLSSFLQETHLSFEEKSFWIQKTKDNIIRLRKGELIPI
ncbi:DNA primase [Helicobacter sp. 12S02634-8]|uniref:DNA primase n=1 Tax=Helicobacter sp. 12S02634-8 TaxID=1476199 RepID=UPI000BA7752D|nr:DNA primase [Helicobacter sp. 12S02634-8]PAF46527.1 DNA primase [Helicobacter sp. 12S02634-8]